MQIRSRSKFSSIAITATIAALLFGLLPAATLPSSAHSCSDLPPGITCVFSGFMTGGGRFNTTTNYAPSSPYSPTGELLTHGFILHCNATDTPNNLEINWNSKTGEHQFHLENLISAHCEMNTALGSPNPPTANFNTWVGNGTGKLDGQPGAFIYAIFTDQSQPAGTQAGGQGDWSTIVIYAPNGTLAIQVTDPLFGGAQQAHMCGGNC